MKSERKSPSAASPLALSQEKAILGDCREIALAAGEKLLRYQKKLSSLKITYKEAQGVASTADVESEKMIVKFLSERYPEHLFMAEESFHASKGGEGAAMERYAKAPWCWSIDPLDGTHNYLNGHPYFAVCLGLLHYGRPVIGLVYRPSTGECFEAGALGPAVKRNLKEGGRPVRLERPRNDKRLKDALLVTGFATEKGELLDQEFELFKGMMSRCRGIRRIGSAALDICYVAQGHWDGFWERGLAPWDTAAASLIAERAGARVSGYGGGDYTPFGQTVVIARAPLYDELVRAL